MSERPDAPQASKLQEEDGRDDMAQYLDRSSNIFPEDELVTWFQYRLDDSFEKDYCSDIFRLWPSPATNAATSYDSQGVCHGAAPEGGQGPSSIVPASELVGSAAKPSSKGEGAIESLARTNSADAALALGAGRAAGIISQTGVESFSKVRTSLQPPAPKLDMPAPGVTKTCASPFPALAPRNLLQKSPTFPSGSSTLQPRARAFASYGNIFSFQQGYTFGKPANYSEPSQPRTVFASENFVSKQSLGTLAVGGSSSSDHTDHSLPESSTTALEAERKQSTNACVYRTKKDTSRIPVQPEQTAAKSRCDAIDSAIDRTWSDSLDRSRMSGVALPPFEKKIDGVDMHSGGSQTSESLKGSKSSTKRKLEDSECQSANAEGESTEIKSYQVRTSTSKRSRAAETHNLSERRRRDRINEKMKALQELIPNSNKTDKASVLDEAIEYLKMLQLQLQMMSIRSGVSLSPAVLPHGLPHMQIPQLGQLHPLGMGMTGGLSGTGAEIGPSVTLGMGIVGGVSGTGQEAGMVMNMDLRMGVPTGASGTGEEVEQNIRVGVESNGGVSGTSAGTGLNIGLGMTDMTYASPARPLSNSPSMLSAPVNHVLRPLSVPTVYTSSSHSQASITTESVPVYFPHSQFQDPSQSIRLVNMDMYNTYLQQHQQLQQLQHQQLQQLNHNHQHKHQQQPGSHSQK